MKYRTRTVTTHDSYGTRLPWLRRLKQALLENQSACKLVAPTRLRTDVASPTEHLLSIHYLFVYMKELASGCENLLLHGRAGSSPSMSVVGVLFVRWNYAGAQVTWYALVYIPCMCIINQKLG